MPSSTLDGPKTGRTTVTTKTIHLPDTGTTRVMVRWSGRHRQIAWDHALSALEAHRHAAAEALDLSTEDLELIGHAENGAAFIWATKKEHHG